jgi:micrococcal nuclease
MRRRRPVPRSAVVAVVAVLAVAGLVLARAGPRTPVLDDPAAIPTIGAPSGPAVPVTRIVDGDTIRVLRDGREERIRLLGIDAPEVNWYGGQAECFGDEAGRFLRRLLSGERVLLEEDREPIDRYGRTLAYVYLEDGLPVNLLLVHEGYAEVTIFPPNDRYEDELLEAEADARAEGRGLWSACA